MNDRVRTILIALLAAVIAFGVGALWQGVKARGYSQRLEVAERDLTYQRLEATLAAATIEAQRGSHELARQLASDFFTGLQSGVTTASADRQSAFQQILATRDAAITSLSRADVQSGSMLAQLFTQYRRALGEPVGQQPAVDSTPMTTSGSP